MNNPYKTYQKTQVTTASREKILLMLYEGAIRFTRLALVAMEEKKIADKGKYISKATAILSELMATLDFKSGGQLATDLENLYVFMIDKLIEGNIQNDAECLRVVENMLRTLYVAWQDVIENPRPDGVPSPKLQPEEYQKWLENNGTPAGKPSAVTEAGSKAVQVKLRNSA
jgi:flagellar secretion chaperone FliS